MGEAMNLCLASPFHLHGVGPAYTWRLAMSNIQTIQELLDYNDQDELSETTGIPASILHLIRLKARSMVNDEVIQLEPFRMPKRKPIYLDIETVPKWNKVWLIGLLIEDEFIQLYASDYDDEKRILSEFNQIIRNHGERCLVTWTGFDTRVLRNRMKLHGLPVSILNTLVHMDLKLKIRRCFIFPTRGYGLKRLGTYLGYSFVNPHLDGLAVSSKYQDHIEMGNSLDPSVFEYNEDDVRVLPFIANWAEKQCNQAELRNEEKSTENKKRELDHAGQSGSMHSVNPLRSIPYFERRTVNH